MIVKLKSIVAFMLSVAMVLGTVGIVIPQGVKAEEVEEFVIEDGVLISYNGADTEVTIPEGVTVIGNSAFWNNKNIVEVTIPEGVKKILPYAFGNCANLTEIEIPSTIMEFGEGALDGSKWLENELEKNSVVIAGNVFVKAAKAKGKLEIPDGIDVIAERAFDLYENGVKVTCEVTEIVLPETVQYIGLGAFEDLENLEKINIPNGVKKIPDFAFCGCTKLKEVVLPDTITYIGFEAFTACKSLEKLWVPSSVTYADSRFYLCFDCPNVTIFCEEGSYIYKYITRYYYAGWTEGFERWEKRYKYELIEKDEKEEAEIVTLTSDNSIVTSDRMADLVELNKDRDIIFQTDTGVTFTFSKGKLTPIEGKESYDFGVTIIKDYAQSQVGEKIEEENFVCELRYDYEGELPGIARVSIDVGKEYVDRYLEYNLLQDDGFMEWMQTALVDENGFVTVSMSHCSDYTFKKGEEAAKSNIDDIPIDENKENEDAGNNSEENNKNDNTENAVTENNNTNNSNQNVQNMDKPQVTNPPSNSAILGDNGKAIKPKKAKIKSLKSVKGKKLKVTWKKDTQANGYQLQVATNKKFTKNKKSFYVNKSKVTNKTVKKLKKGKKYYVRVRAFKKVNGNKVYGKWSAVKKSKKIR